ncbi:MAG: BPSS1780 family membrane protein [Wenzhouxiangellaceae bacterium]|nr:BPSS1780 family membrane protein [Wenzhouxiangellaceae bacterium]
MAQKPNISTAKFSDGVSWLTGGGNLLARGGPALIRVALVLWLFSMLRWIPILGAIALIVISPALTAGMLNVFRAVGRGEPAQPSLLLAGFHDPSVRKRLLMLGLFLLIGLSAALAVLVGWLAPQVDADALNAVLSESEASAGQAQRLFAVFQDVNWFGGVVAAALVLAPVLGGLYFSVPLVFFWRWPALTAVIWSFRALLVNWLAFLGFGLAMFGVLLIAGLVFGLIDQLLNVALGGLGQMLSQLVSMILSLFFQLLIGAAQWLSFVRVFPVDSDELQQADDSIRG